MTTISHAAATAVPREHWRTYLDAALAYCDAHAAVSSNGTLCRLAGWLWRRGTSADDLEALLLAVNDHLFKKPRAKVLSITRWIRRKPRDGGRRALPDVAMARFLTDVGRAIDGSSWRGQSGKNQRAVLEGHLALAAGRQSPLHDASVRLLMTLSGCSYGTVRRSHRRLEKAGWLVLVYPSQCNQDTTGSLWNLQVPPAPLAASPGAGKKGDVVAQVAFTDRPADWAAESAFLPAPGEQLGHPLFQDGGGGFGKSVGSMVLALEKASAFRSLKAWAKAAQVDARTVSRHLFLLQFTGLVTRRTAWPRCFLRGPATFDEVAAQVGLDHRAATICRQHAQQREEYRERLAATRNPYQPDKVYVLRRKGLRLVPPRGS